VQRFQQKDRHCVFAFQSPLNDPALLFRQRNLIDSGEILVCIDHLLYQVVADVAVCEKGAQHWLILVFIKPLEQIIRQAVEIILLEILDRQRR